MPKLTSERLPKYRKHRASGQAVVTLNGVDCYLGPHGTQTSKREYDRLTAEWLANGRQLASANDRTIAEMLVEYWRFAQRHYRKDGRPTHELTNIKSALRPLKAMYAKLPVHDFGPLKFQALQSLFVKGYTTADGETVEGLARKTVNARIGAIKRVFRWAVSQEMAPPSLAHALDTVRGLQQGRTEAHETEPVRPVADATVEATLPHLPAVVADMVRVQRLTGCRPNEICSMRPVDIDRTVSPWKYRPESHKMQHFGRDRVIFIGPKAQAVLLPYLLRDPETNCFSPSESEAKRKAELRARRKTRVQPSQFDRRSKRPKLRPSDRYVKDSYRRAIVRAADAADQAAHEADGTVPKGERVVPRWSPNQLRHAMGTEVRQKFQSIEAAQVVLGHSKASTTEIYAERDQRLAADIIKQIG